MGCGHCGLFEPHERFPAPTWGANSCMGQRKTSLHHFFPLFQVEPIHHYPVAEINENSKRLINSHSAAFSDERKLQQVIHSWHCAAISRKKCEQLEFGTWWGPTTGLHGANELQPQTNCSDQHWMRHATWQVCIAFGDRFFCHFFSFSPGQHQQVQKGDCVVFFCSTCTQSKHSVFLLWHGIWAIGMNRIISFAFWSSLFQRQRLWAVPITECSYSWRNKKGKFWVYGQDMNCYAPEYPQRHCWGCQISWTRKADCPEDIWWVPRAMFAFLCKPVSDIHAG